MALSKTSPNVQHPRLRKTIKIAIIVVLSVCLGWLTVINLALWTGLVKWIVSGKHERATLHLDHGFAWCVWPTRVHINDLHLAIDTYKWQMEIEIPQAEVQLSLSALLSRHFHAKKLTGDDVELAFALKLQKDIHDLGRIEAFKAIEGLPRPVRPDQRPARPSLDKAWLIELESVNVGIRRLWVNEIDGRIDARLAGGLQFLGGHLLAIPSARLDIIGGRLFIDDRPMLSALTGSLDVEVAAYDPRTVEGRPVLRQLSGRVVVLAALADAKWARFYLAKKKIGARGGIGALFGAVHVAAGNVMPGSVLDLRTQKLGLVKQGTTLEADAHAHATVRNAEHGRLAVTVTDVRATSESSDQPWLKVPKARALVVSGVTNLASRPWPIVDGFADIPSFRIADLGAIDTGKSKLQLESGAVVGHARADISPDAIAIEFAADAAGIGLSAAKTRISGGGYVRAKGSVDRDEKVVVLDPLHAKLRDIEIHTDKGDSSGTWVEIGRSRVEYATQEKQLTASLHGRLEDLAPVLAHARSGEGILEQIAQMEVGDPVDYALTIRRTPAYLLVQVQELAGRGVDARAIFARAGSKKRVAVHFERAAVGIVVEGKRRNIEVAKGDDWYRRKVQWVEAITKPSSKRAR